MCWATRERYDHGMPLSRPDDGIPINPYESDQEPYVHIVAPGIDQISRATFRRGSLEFRRVLRGLAVLGVAVGVLVVVAVIGALVASRQ